jgi:hypothetical protein
LSVSWQVASVWHVRGPTFDLPGVDFEAAKAMVRSAADTVRVGTLGCALIVATKRDA